MVTSLARKLFGAAAAEPAKVSKASDVYLLIPVRATEYTKASDSSEFFVQGVPRKVLIKRTKKRKPFYEWWFAGSLKLPGKDDTGWRFYDAQLSIRGHDWQFLCRYPTYRQGIAAYLYCSDLFPDDEVSPSRLPIFIHLSKKSFKSARGLAAVYAGSRSEASKSAIFTHQELTSEHSVAPS